MNTDLTAETIKVREELLTTMRAAGRDLCYRVNLQTRSIPQLKPFWCEYTQDQHKFTLLTPAQEQTAQALLDAGDITAEFQYRIPKNGDGAKRIKFFQNFAWATAANDEIVLLHTRTRSLPVPPVRPLYPPAGMCSIERKDQSQVVTRVEIDAPQTLQRAAALKVRKLIDQGLAIPGSPEIAFLPLQKDHVQEEIRQITFLTLHL